MSADKPTTTMVPTGSAPGGGNGEAFGVTPRAKISYITINQGAPNEHLIIMQQLNKPGKYSYSTSTPNHETVDKIKPEDEASLNRGVSLAAELFTHPVLTMVPPPMPGPEDNVQFHY